MKTLTKTRPETNKLMNNSPSPSKNKGKKRKEKKKTDPKDVWLGTCKKARDGIGFKVKIEMDVNVPPLGIPWTVMWCLIAATVSSLL